MAPLPKQMRPIMINEIKKLWDEGKSFSQIAKVMNTTKGAIAGSIHRAKKAGMYFNPHIKPKKKEKKRVVKLDLSGEVLNIRRFRDKPNICRYILNEDVARPIFCSEPIFYRSYCHGHASRCYISMREKKI